METPSPESTQAETPATKPPLEITPELCAVLGVPADQVTPESVQAAAAALAEKATKADQLATTLADVQAQLGTLQAADQERLAAQLDTELADYDLDEETLGVVKALSPEQRKPLLGKLPKKTVAVPADAVKDPKAEVPPPKPMHDPKADATAAETTQEQRAQDAEALIAAIRKEGKFTDYTTAREEARRRKPELFS